MISGVDAAAAAVEEEDFGVAAGPAGTVPFPTWFVGLVPEAVFGAPVVPAVLAFVVAAPGPPVEFENPVIVGTEAGLAPGVTGAGSACLLRMSCDAILSAPSRRLLTCDINWLENFEGQGLAAAATSVMYCVGSSTNEIAAFEYTDAIRNSESRAADWEASGRAPTIEATAASNVNVSATRYST